MHPDLAAITNTQGGVFTAEQARHLGYTRDEMRARLDSRRWVRVRHGIYRPAGDVDEYVVHVSAALVASRGSDPVASHRCAAVLFGLPLLVTPTLPELTLGARSNTTSLKDCVVHREEVPPSDRGVTRGLATTSAARTVVDLARSLSFAGTVVAADAALRSGLVTRTQLLEAAAAFQGRPTYPRIARALKFADERAASAGESMARTSFAEQGLPTPELAQQIIVDGRVIAEVDFLWEDERTVGEFDGRVKYLAGNDRGDDVLWQEKLREEQLRAAGYEVVRMTWAQITREPRKTAERLRTAFARQRRHLMTG